MDFLNSDFSSSDPNNSGAFKKIGADATKNLSGSQKKVLYETLKKYKGSSNPAEKALGELAVRRDDGISSDRVNKMKAMLRLGKLDRSGCYSSRKSSPSDNHGIAQVGANRSAVTPVKKETGAVVVQQITGMNRRLNLGNLGVAGTRH